MFLRSVDSEKDCRTCWRVEIAVKLYGRTYLVGPGRIMPERRTYLVKNFQKEVLKLFEVIL